MPIFAVTYRYSADTALRDATRPEHRTYLRELADQGVVLLAGARAASEEPGGLLVLRTPDRAAVDAIVVQDPYVTGGVVVGSEVVEWEPAFGTLIAALG